MKNFINQKGIKLLDLINEREQLFCNILVGELKEKNIMSRSSFYRYIHSFEKWGLIEKSDRKKKENQYFVRYQLSSKGFKLITFLNRNQLFL